GRGCGAATRADRLGASHAQSFDRLAIRSAFGGTRVSDRLHSGNRTQDLIDGASRNISRKTSASLMPPRENWRVQRRDLSGGSRSQKKQTPAPLHGHTAGVEVPPE